MAQPSEPVAYGVCGTCTLQMVELAYRRAPWFRLVREPLRLGMKLMGRWHGIDPRRYAVRTASCCGCIRFLKTALRERSATARWLNARINPVFDHILESIVTSDEVAAAKHYARQATQADGNANPSGEGPNKEG